ncbi:hypothetical protein IV203_031439 [Nitzschia inconspicua]|uniref:Uncharacterized protein n=1 Tax=Nitzschia inconspicua TaxID=303405 RepID=A0A9K3Q2M5_9STRA|nr:hypothetical protein IV203_031431 [Nitzschia inconspicua]KAG7368696.1 hypothetical protein IV203_031439 [Nitzschia inconspicua]
MNPSSSSLDIQHRQLIMGRHPTLLKRPRVGVALKNHDRHDDDNVIIDYQSDTTNYGRGDRHLSATLDRGDVVVFQTGVWFVDGVEVGDGSSQTASFRYGVVETIQVVWTHNCEHGVIRVWPLSIAEQDGDATTTAQFLTLNQSTDECVEFGPEQLVAKLPLVWEDGAERMQSPVMLRDDMWEVAQRQDA